MQANAVQGKAPWWAWAFMGICVAIPVVSLGGAIPGALGCGGAGACYGIASGKKGSGQRRALLCTLVAFACWAAFGGLVFAVHITTAGPSITEPGTTAPQSSRTETRSRPPAVVVQTPRVPLSQANQANLEESSTAKTTAIQSLATTPSVRASGTVDDDSLSLEERQKIYAKATSRRAMIASSQEALDRRQREGKSTEVPAKQLEHAKRMYERHLDFSCQFNRISRAELDAIIREGDQAGWPAG